jgi:hypothetical protein
MNAKPAKPIERAKTRMPVSLVATTMRVVKSRRTNQLQLAASFVGDTAAGTLFFGICARCRSIKTLHDVAARGLMVYLRTVTVRCLANYRVKAGAVEVAGDPQLSLDRLLEIEGLIVIIVFEAIFELPSPDLRNNHFFCRLLLTSHQFYLIFGCHWIYVFRLCGESNAFVISRLQADRAIGLVCAGAVGTNRPKHLYLGFWSRNNWRRASPSVDRQEGPVVLIHNVFSTFILVGRTRLLRDLAPVSCSS